MASDLGLHCLHNNPKGVSGLKAVKVYMHTFVNVCHFVWLLQQGAIYFFFHMAVNYSVRPYAHNYVDPSVKFSFAKNDFEGCFNYCFP